MNLPKTKQDWITALKTFATASAHFLLGVAAIGIALLTAHGFFAVPESVVPQAQRISAHAAFFLTLFFFYGGSWSVYRYWRICMDA